MFCKFCCGATFYLVLSDHCLPPFQTLSVWFSSFAVCYLTSILVSVSYIKIPTCESYKVYLVSMWIQGNWSPTKQNCACDFNIWSYFNVSVIVQSCNFYLRYHHYKNVKKILSCSYLILHDNSVYQGCSLYKPSLHSNR